jgi:glycosyltransferase involved in cell wall biosynthesis
MGVEPLVFLPKEGPVEEKLRENRTTFSICPYSTWVSKRWRLKSVVRKALQNHLCSRRLAAALAPQGVKLVHSNSSVTNIGALVASRLRVPHIWHVREFGELDYGTRPEWGRKLFIRALGQSEAAVLMSETLKYHLWKAINPPNARVIYDGIASKEEFDRRRKESLRTLATKAEKRPFTFILVGLMQPQKGQSIAIRALHRVQQKYPNVRLWLVGSGTEAYVEECRVIASQLGVSGKITFWGYVDNPNPLYCEADCGLMCSQSEAFGLVTVEAMSFCRPVIGFRGGATPELVTPEENGLLYSGGEAELAACMERMVATPQWANQLGEKAWRFVSERFTTESTAMAVRSLYEEALKDRSLRTRLNSVN